MKKMNTVKLVRHGVENDVYTHGIGFLLGEFTKIPFVLAFAFPAVSEICIVANDTHDTAVIVEDGPVVNFVRSVALVSYDPHSQRGSCRPRARRLGPGVFHQDRRPCGRWDDRLIILRARDLGRLVLFRSRNCHTRRRPKNRLP